MLCSFRASLFTSVGTLHGEHFIDTSGECDGGDSYISPVHMPYHPCCCHLHDLLILTVVTSLRSLPASGRACKSFHALFSIQ